MTVIIPGVVGGGFAVDEYATASWPQWCGIKVEGTKRSSHAESVGLHRLNRRRFRVSSACGRSRSHQFAGKEGAAPPGQQCGL